jgi:hypothetical protein
MAVNREVVERALAAVRALSESPSPETAKPTAAVCDPPVEKSGSLCPGPDVCGGCYSVGVLDGRERFIHPPKASAEWETWLKRWQPKGRIQ